MYKYLNCLMTKDQTYKLVEKMLYRFPANHSGKVAEHWRGVINAACSDFSDSELLILNDKYFRQIKAGQPQKTCHKIVFTILAKAITAGLIKEISRNEPNFKRPLEK